MGRTQGTFNFAANFEVTTKAPLNASQLVDYKSDLTGATTWNQSGQIWLYDGAFVSVGKDPVTENRGLYFLLDAANYNDITKWIKIGDGGGTITGGTNGLSVYGKNIGLGGDLTGNTVINGLGLYNITLDNINDFQITPSGSSNITFGVDETGLLYSFTGGSITYDDNGGLKYGGNYSGNYTDRSLVDKEYVDAVATGLDPKNAVALTTTTSDGNIDLTGGTFGGTIDGLTVKDGWRVLIKNQTDASENGIYDYSSGTTSFSRSSDFDGTPSGEVTQGALIPVITGNTLYNTLWILTTEDPITIGTTDLDFTLFSKQTDYTAGTGITITNNIISVDGASLAGDSISWSANTFNVDVNSGSLKTALDSKLNVSNFNTYSANTDTRITNIESDINYLSGVTDTKLNTSVFTGYTASTNTRFDNIENNIDYLSGVTDTKLDTDIFTGYTATTQPIIDAAVTGATNGLTKSGRNIKLGGSLSENTNINTGSYSFEVRSSLNNFVCVGGNVACIGNGFGYLEFNGGCVTLLATNRDMAISSTSGITQCSFGHMSISYGRTDGNRMTVEDCNSSPHGIEYVGNYSASFINRSLVDKEYVDTHITGSSNTVNVCNVTSNYTATTTNDFIGVSGATTIYLPNPPKSCQRITVVDICGNALASNIIICGNGMNINGDSCATINTDYGSMTFINNGVFWSAVAFIN